MTEENGVERPALKFMLKAKDSLYTIVNQTPLANGIHDASEQDLNDQNSKMTDSTPDNSFGENGMHDNSDELNTPNVSPEKDIPTNADATTDDFTHTEYSFTASSFPPKENGDEENSNPPSETSVSNSDGVAYTDKDEGEQSNTVLDSENMKPAAAKEMEEEASSDQSIVVKKEKPENGELEEKEQDKPDEPHGESNDGLDSDATTAPASRPCGEKPANLPASRPCIEPTNNGTTSNNEDDNDDTETIAAPQEETRPMISVRKPEDLLISKVQVNGSLEEPCIVCGKRFGSMTQLEQHKATAGHYNCTECAGSVFQTLQELSQHQATHHQSSVQQLAQQVQRIPAQFQSQAFRVPTPPQRNISPQYMSPPPMGSSQTIGSGVVLSPVSPSVPNLPPGIQLSKRPATIPPESSSPKQRREEFETRRLPDSITLSRTPATPPSPARNSVTDMLANRGITVVPSGRSSNPPQPAAPTLPRALSSAISITPSSQQQPVARQSNFAVPAPKPVSRVLTVDLTKDSDSPPRRNIPSRGRMRGTSTRSVCQICDKAFPTPQELQGHMAIHRGGPTPNKLAYECRECTAQYPTEAGLQAHRQKYHGAGGPSPDMAIPVVDLKQGGVMTRLASLGIRFVIPLSQLHSGSGNGLFGLPVVAVDAANNPAICNIGGLGASNLLPLGPLKNMNFNNNLR